MHDLKVMITAACLLLLFMIFFVGCAPERPNDQLGKNFSSMPCDQDNCGKEPG